MNMYSVGVVVEDEVQHRPVVHPCLACTSTCSLRPARPGRAHLGMTLEPLLWLH